MSECTERVHSVLIVFYWFTLFQYIYVDTSITVRYTNARHSGDTLSPSNSISLCL